ncbi:class I SAM-dependent RNA methyltransferase [Methylocapsa sp. D3K7]|uniref:class I SAM-dependent RNA methyltransferase n=1 Tax=Methylocapsa sp. D3K7 TaxID=3041435 RepID=UPI00244EEC6D|nr:class I SAM-dependent RNA methyltransferase [Methylocapsa sp. D3K7]WGJ13927.1 class I SAM-dependent RNA methyltransferase [Methylocapsa sp. D3K7]
MISFHTRLTIDRLGRRGEGVAQGPDGLIFVPYALAGETVIAEIDGSRGTLIEVLTPSPDRITPFCRYYSRCGGCAVQALRVETYAQWKRDLVAEALQRAGLHAEVAVLIDAHGAGRRRATFHARYPQGRAKTGFTQARTHDIVEIASCPVLASSLDEALPAARALAQTLAASDKPLDILVTATASGLDVDLKGHGPLGEAATQRLVKIALAHNLARLSNHGEVVVSNRTPILTMGKAIVAPPPGAFLQATESGEDILAAKVCAHINGAKLVADLFSGIGTFALRLAEFAKVDAFDLEESALQALAKAACVKGLHQVAVTPRDLFTRPLCPAELERYDAIVFDPPRAGAEQQAKALAASQVPLIVAVSCNADSFARDAAILCAGGYQISKVEPIDQFRHTPHVEIVAGFRRQTEKRRRIRPLLG